MHTAPARRSLMRRVHLAFVTIIVVAIAVLGMETAYALWQDQAGADAGAVTTGTSALTAEWSSENDTDSWQNLVPGDQAQRDVTITNTGDVPLTLEASSASAEFDIQLSGSDLVLEPGQRAVVAIELTATDALVPTSEISLEVQFDGRQAR